MNNFVKKFSVFALALASLFPVSAYAVMQSLNGLTGSSQTFANDTNLTISSSGTQHSLGWSGILSFLRGGTGTSTFANGGLVFSDGTKLTQNPSNLFWDNTNGFLGIGTTTPEAGLHVTGDIKVSPTIIGGNTAIITANGFSALYSLGIRGTLAMNNSSDIEFTDSEGTMRIDIFSPASNIFTLMQAGEIERNVNLDISRIDATNQTFAFPDYSGTFGLLEANQTWTGLNKFEASTNSTVYVGSATKSGCLVMGDSDGSGVTYVTANDGVLSATTTQPSICQ